MTIATSFEPEPRHIDLDPQHTALVTVELQRGVCGDLAMLADLARAQTDSGALEATVRLAAAARDVGVTIIHCTAVTDPAMPRRTNAPILAATDALAHVLQIDTPGAQVIPELVSPTDLESRRINGMTPFVGTDLDQLLTDRSITDVIIAGNSVNVGVTGAVMNAVDLGYRVVVAADAVVGLPASYAHQVTRHTLAHLATIATTDQLIESFGGNDDLLRCWGAVGAELGAEASRWTEILAETLSRHVGEDRHYHGARHVQAVVTALRKLTARRSPELLLAAVFHDAILDPTKVDNEHRSAQLARDILGGVGIDAGVVRTTAQIIEATASHTVPTDAGDDEAAGLTATFLDADLSILGADPETYKHYVTQVRREYRHVSAADWRQGRSAVLRAFAERDRLYLTDRGQTLWEASARANLDAELATLDGEA